jgi:hypothetical protein
MTPWALVGLVLLALGLERLLNLGMLGGDVSSHPVRFLFATAATVTGGLLLAVAGRFSSR